MSIRPPDTLFGRRVNHIHCVGVMGMGLGPLAIYLSQLGYRVTGEDGTVHEGMAESLRAGGVVVGDLGEVPDGTDLLVISSAVPSSHPSVKLGSSRGIQVVKRGEALAEVVRDRALIAVCGSHGKTTTTALLVSALRTAGFEAGYILGGLFNDGTPPAAVGTLEWVVAEIDESDGTIERFSPEIAVTVSLDWDHPDHYPTEDALVAAFSRLYARTRGHVLVPAGCRYSGSAIAHVAGPRIHRYGVEGEYRRVDWKQEGARQTLQLGGAFRIPHATVLARGEFNSLNATAALAAAQLAGARLAEGLLAGFPGVRRRQSAIDAPEGFIVLEDYAHHPAEIEALLRSLRAGLAAGARLVAVFQPHRFSRTKQFLSGFSDALALADQVALIDVYGAGEQVIKGGETSDLYADFRKRHAAVPVDYCGPHLERLFVALARTVKPGDVLVWVGAGDIDQTARSWVARLPQLRRSAAEWDELAERLRSSVSPDTRIHREETLATRTTMRVGGAARILVEPANETDLVQVHAFLRREGRPLLLLGRGSNLLVPDTGVDAVVVALTAAPWQVFEPQSDGRIWVGAGLRLKNLCGLAAKAGFQGFEFLEGIPGNVGGALRMNAGAMGGWTFNVVDEVRLLTPDGRVENRKRAQMDVDYRHCGDLDEAIALGAWLRPVGGTESAEVNAQIEQYRDKRQKSQPREPSAGCIFKNPPNDSAGRLIDISGLKGMQVGGAMVSPVHANFIVNMGEATSADVIELVRRVRSEVKAAQGIELNPEVILFGRDWKDVL